MLSVKSVNKRLSHEHGLKHKGHFHQWRVSLPVNAGVGLSHKSQKNRKKSFLMKGPFTKSLEFTGFS